MSGSDGGCTRLGDCGWALLMARLVVGFTLITYSMAKLHDPVAFLKVIKLYEIVPLTWPTVLNSMAVIIPWVELLGGVALILGVGLRGAGVVLLAMLIVFTAAVALRTWDVVQAGTPFLQVKFDCGCGKGEEIIWQKLLSNAGLILLTLLATASRSRFLCLSALFGGSPIQRPAPVADAH